MDYRDEYFRLASFKTFPLPYIDREKFAAAGFYYIGESDIVRCFECQLELHKWLAVDDPVRDHKRASRRCNFVNKVPCGNIPIRHNYNPFLSLSYQDIDSYIFVDRSKFDEAIPDNLHGTFSSNVQIATYQAFCSYSNRFDSFYSWQKTDFEIRVHLAEAGFFFMEHKILCFYCGMLLCDWRNQNPWVIHALEKPYCHYLITIRGQDYSENIFDIFLRWDSSFDSQSSAINEKDALMKRRLSVAISVRKQPHTQQTHM